MQAFLEYKLKNLFSGAFDKELDASPLPISVPLASPRQVSSIAAMIRAAKRPVMLIASQATLFSAYGPDGVDPLAHEKVQALLCFAAACMLPQMPSRVN